MMSQQRSAMTSMFADDPFFSQERLLWPLNREALSSLQEDFFNRRTKLADSLLAEFHDGTQKHMDLRQGPFLRLPLRRSSNSTEPKAESPSMELREVAQKVTGNSNGDLLVTLDVRGYAPEDITVKIEGRSLAVVAMKQAGAEESQSNSSSASSSRSSSSSFSSSSSASSRTGFVRRINLPAHLDLSGLSCSLMDDGQLRIAAPAAKQPIDEEEHQVPIRFRSSLEFPISKETEDTHTD